MEVGFISRDKTLGPNKVGVESPNFNENISYNESLNKISFVFSKESNFAPNNIQMLLDVFLAFIVRRKFSELTNDEAKEIEENILRVNEIIRIAKKRNERMKSFNSSYKSH